MSKILLFALFFISNPSTQVDTINQNYYTCTNKAKRAFVNRDFESCANALLEIRRDNLFAGDVRLLEKCEDSLIQYKGDQKLIKKLRTKKQNAKCYLMDYSTNLNFGNKTIDYGIYLRKMPPTVPSKKLLQKINKIKSQHEEYHNYLKNIVALDRFSAYIRSTSKFNRETIDSLFAASATNTLRVFKEVNFPTNDGNSLIWNENLMLAFMHNIGSSNKTQREELLRYFKLEADKGNISYSQYAIFYDFYFQEYHEGKSFYGTATESVQDDSGNWKIKAVPVYKPKELNKRRNEIHLIPIKDYYQLYNIQFDEANILDF